MASTHGAKSTRAAGDAHDAYRDASAAVSSVLENVEDKVRDIIQTRPYTALAGMFAMGFLVALLRR
jgi:hypothetical protein